MPKEQKLSSIVLVSLTIDPSKKKEIASLKQTWLDAGVGIQRVRFFEGDKRNKNMFCVLFTRDPDIFKDKAPEGWWRKNIVSPIGGKGGKVYAVTDNGEIPSGFTEYIPETSG